MFGIGRNKTLSELINIHDAALADKKIKDDIDSKARAAYRDAFEELLHLDVATIDSDATRHRISALKAAKDKAWGVYYKALLYERKTLEDIS